MKKTKKPTRKKAATILIVDDHPAVREALALRVSRQPDLRVCGEAADVVEALRIVEDTEPDVAVIDIALKGGSGIDLIKRIKARHYKTRSLVWSMYDESLFAERALRAGAMGYLNKEEATEKIVDAVYQVLDGKVYLSPAMTEALIQQAVGDSGSHLGRPAIEALSDREMEVYRLIGTGSKTQEIADQMHLSAKTVETYRDRIRAKLSLKDGAQLARHALQWVLDNG